MSALIKPVSGSIAIKAPFFPVNSLNKVLWSSKSMESFRFLPFFGGSVDTTLITFP